jgi:hypothetical protein
MGLQPVRMPNPVHTGVAAADDPGHRPRAPMRGCLRLLTQPLLHYPGNHLRRQRRLACQDGLHRAATHRSPAQGSASATATPTACSGLPRARSTSSRDPPPTAAQCEIATPISTACSGLPSNFPAPPDPQERARCIPQPSSEHYRTTEPTWESFVSSSTLALPAAGRGALITRPALAPLAWA